MKDWGSLTLRHSLKFAVVALSALVLSVAAEETQPTNDTQINDRPVSAPRIDKVRLFPDSKDQYIEIFSGNYDVVEFHDREFVAYLTPEQISTLESIGVRTETEITDYSNFVAERYKREESERASSGGLTGVTESATMGGFETLSEIEAHIDQAASDHSSIMTAKFSIGTSIEGRDIWAFKISDNPGIDEDEPEVLFVSLIHSREPCAGAVVLNVMDYLTDNYGVITEITELVDTREIYFIPVQNPDGYAYNQSTNPGGGGMWRKNRRNNGGSFGVDLNRNFDNHWGYDDLGSSPNPNSETYRGTAPFSEPEIQATRDFILSRNFSIIHNHHCYSNLEIWPTGYDRFYSYDEDAFQHIGDTLTKDNGYTAAIGWNLYPTNGDADDWAYGDTTGGKPSIPSITVEIGGSSEGFWPSLAQIPGLIAENLEPNLFIIKIADNPFKVGPPRAPVASTPIDTVEADTIHLDWFTTDTINPAVQYHLYELGGFARDTDDVEIDYGFWNTVRFNRVTNRTHGGSFSWHENGANQSHHWLSANTPVRVKDGDSLTFWIWYDIETDWDYFYAQVSSDGGFVYDNLPHPTLTTNTNPHGTNVGNGITGSSGGWIYAAFDLSAYAGQEIYVRLSYFTDFGFREEGVYLDDINLIETYATDTLVAGAITDTTLTLNGQPNGERYFYVRTEDAEAQVGRKSNIVPVVVNAPPPYVCGDADGSNTVNIADVTFLISRIFSGGPAPVPPEAGDADGSGGINIADVTYLIARIFSGGPAPVCP